MAAAGARAYPVAVVGNAPSLIRAAAPLVRAAAGAARNSTVRAAAANVARRLDPMGGGATRATFAPAALRVERWRAVRAGERVDQTAVTMWFGEGPALPRPGGSDSLRGVARVGAGVLGAAALAAMTAIAARREAERGRVIEGVARPAVESPGDR